MKIILVPCLCLFVIVSISCSLLSSSKDRTNDPRFTKYLGTFILPERMNIWHFDSEPSELMHATSVLSEHKTSLEKGTQITITKIKALHPNRLAKLDIIAIGYAELDSENKIKFEYDLGMIDNDDNFRELRRSGKHPLSDKYKK